MSQTYNAYYPMVPFTFDEVKSGGENFDPTLINSWSSDIFIGRFVLWINNGIGEIYRKTKDDFQFIGKIGTIDPDNTNINLHLQWTELP